MEIVEATGRVLEAGKSPELTALLANVAEATAADGEPRYAPKTYRDLARSIVCRTYAKPALQLCHLINAADACGSGRDRWESFFYGVDAARPSAFRGYLFEALDNGGWRRPGIEADAEGVSIRYDDGFFNIRYGRMPLLAALLETVLTMVGYREIDGIFQDMLKRAGSLTAVGDAANAINRLIYAYLRENLTSAQAGDKFDAIVTFLKFRAASMGQPNGSGAITIDDEALLDFWLKHTPEAEHSGDFRAFKTVAGAFVDLLRALESTSDQQAIQYATSIGSDREAGEVDPGSIYGEELADTMGGEWTDPFTALDLPPADAIKFLNKVEREALDTLMDYGPLAGELPLTVLRADIFGMAQGRVTQALRRGQKPPAITDLVACAEVENYADRMARYRQSDDQLAQVQKAALHVLSSDQAVVAVAPADNQEADEATNIVPLFGRQVSVANDLPDVRAEARAAFNNISRKGFNEADLDDPDIREGFSIGAEALVHGRDHLAAYLAILENYELEAPGLAEIFQADRALFSKQFSVLYGGAP